MVPSYLVTSPFHLSSRLCPSTAGCSPPSMSSIVLWQVFSCSRWFPPTLLRHLAIFCLLVPLISSLSLVCTLCSVWSTCCLWFLLYTEMVLCNICSGLTPCSPESANRARGPPPPPPTTHPTPTPPSFNFKMVLGPPC